MGGTLGAVVGECQLAGTGQCWRTGRRPSSGPRMICAAIAFAGSRTQPLNDVELELAEPEDSLRAPGPQILWRSRHPVRKRKPSVAEHQLVTAHTDDGVLAWRLPTARNGCGVEISLSQSFAHAQCGRVGASRSRLPSGARSDGSARPRT